jgi:hypothetical protein
VAVRGHPQVRGAVMSTLLGARTRVGLPVVAMSCAIAKVFPVPVAPLRTRRRGPTLGAARDVARRSTTPRCSAVGGQIERRSNGRWARRSSRPTKLSTASRFASRAASTTPASTSSKAASVSADRDGAGDLSDAVGDGVSKGAGMGGSNGDSNGASVRPPTMSSRLEGAVVGAGSRGRLVS